MQSESTPLELPNIEGRCLTTSMRSPHDTAGQPLSFNDFKFHAVPYFFTIVKISSSASSCDNPTFCGWCFTLLPHTTATLKSSIIVL